MERVSFLSRQTVIAALTANALRPPRGQRSGVPSFAAGWLFGETAPQVLALTQDDTVEARHVEIGQASGTWVAVTKGLAEGDRVIVDGVQKARPGQKVTATAAKT